MYTADPNVIPKPQVEKCCLVRQWAFSLRAYMYTSSVTLLSMVLMPQRTHPMNETIVYESPWIRIGSRPMPYNTCTECFTTSCCLTVPYKFRISVTDATPCDPKFKDQSFITLTVRYGDLNTQI